MRCFPHPQGPEGKIQIVTDHNEILQRNFELVHPISDSVATEIHVGGRLQQSEGPSFELYLGDVAVSFS